MPRLQQVLDLLLPDLSLADAGAEHVALIASLFAVLDDSGIPGTRGTVLSKVLHRRRPALIPLHDGQVRTVCLDAEPAPVPYDPRREWSFWQDVADLAPLVPITPLRAFDIVAWWAGNGRVRPDPDVPDEPLAPAPDHLTG